MSFNAKNLSYESNEPAFLRRLRLHVAEQEGSCLVKRVCITLVIGLKTHADCELCVRGEHGVHDPSRHERPLARPRKQVQEGEKDEQPTYVVEDSQETLSKAEYEALVATNDADRQNEKDMPSSTEAHLDLEEAELRKDEVTRGVAPVKQRVAGIGSSSKRRLAKVVGKEEEEEEEEEKEDGSAPEMSDSRKKDKKIRAKKGKKMKLSFDEEGTEA